MTTLNPPEAFSIDTCRSYATETNLVRALTSLGLNRARPLVVRNRAGRFTAVFGYGSLGNIMPVLVANAGFMVIG